MLHSSYAGPGAAVTKSALKTTSLCVHSGRLALQVRGLLISLKEAVVVIGILLGYLGGALWIEDVGGWRAMFGAAAFPAVVLGAGMFWLMESPRWLLLSGAPKAEVSAPNTMRHRAVSKQNLLTRGSTAG